MKKYKQHVECTLSNLLRSPVSLWGTDSYEVFFERSQLDPLKIKTAFPDMCITDDNEANLSRHITTTVEQYFTLSLWEKLWWRLTKPINHYLMLNDILTLNQMKEALAEDLVSKSVVIYNQSSLSQHLDFWDSLVTSWRYLLDNFVLTISPRYKESLIRDSLIYMKEPVKETELICKINHYVESMNKQFKGLGSYYIYIEKERVLDNLQNEYNVCEKILNKLNPVNNQHINAVQQCAQAVMKVKQQVEYRLNTLSMEHRSLEEMVNELLSQEYLTLGERNCLNVFKDKKQQLAASDVKHKQFDLDVKQLQENASKQDQALDKLDRDINRLQENFGKQDQDFKQLQENASKRDQDLKQLQENVGKRDQDLKQLQENVGKQDQDFKQFKQTIQADYVQLKGDIVQFFSQPADTDNDLLIEQTEEEYTDEETSNSNTRMP